MRPASKAYRGGGVRPIEPSLAQSGIFGAFGSRGHDLTDIGRGEVGASAGGRSHGSERSGARRGRSGADLQQRIGSSPGPAD
jgi:hypothetical protein